MQQQAQAIAAQRLQMELQMKETEHAAEEVAKLGEDAEVYKTVGSILVKSKKIKVEEELKDRKETLDLRIKTLQRQEEKIQSRLKEMQAQIQEELKSVKQRAAG